MSNVVTLLARLGASTDPVDALAIARLGELSDDVRAALLAHDVEALRALTGAQANLACFVFTPDENDEPLPERQPDEDQPEPGEGESRAA